MKKLLALTAFAAAFAGCDFVNPDDADVEVASLTIAGLPAVAVDSDTSLAAAGTPPDYVVEIQNAAGRAIYQSERFDDYVGTSITLSDDFELEQNGLPFYVAVLDFNGTQNGGRDTYTRVSFSEAFTGEQLAAAAAGTDSTGVAASSYSVASSNGVTATFGFEASAD